MSERRFRRTAGEVRSLRLHDVSGSAVRCYIEQQWDAVMAS
jgi:hypothetical protein